MLQGRTMMNGLTNAKMIEKGPTREKNEEKVPTKVIMKGIDPQKNFSSANIKKVPRAYESLNPALPVFPQKFGQLCTGLTKNYHITCLFGSNYCNTFLNVKVFHI